MATPSTLRDTAMLLGDTASHSTNRREYSSKRYDMPPLFSDVRPQQAIPGITQVLHTSLGPRT